MGLVSMRNRLLAKVFTAFPSLAARWARNLERNTDRVPWEEPKAPLHQATVAVVTTGGVHLRDDEPFDMKDPDGDPSYREIPIDTKPDTLVITHDYYDHADAREDIDLVLPVPSLRELASRGAVGRLHPVAYSFMGHIDGPHLDTLRRQTARAVAARLRAGAVDYALLVPA